MKRYIATGMGGFFNNDPTLGRRVVQGWGRCSLAASACLPAYIDVRQAAASR